MRGALRVLVLVGFGHDVLPLDVHVVEVLRLLRQLLPDVLTQEDILDNGNVLIRTRIWSIQIYYTLSIYCTAL